MTLFYIVGYLMIIAVVFRLVVGNYPDDLD
jgi:hypothetical protein